jgi:predicted membrane protein
MIILDQKPDSSNENQNQSSNEHPYHKTSNSNIFLALIFIIAGIVILGKNVGFIDYFIYRFIISWQMLLVAIGVYSLSKGHHTTGVVLTIIGVLFLLPLMPFLPRFHFFGARDFWPILFIVIGIIVLVNSKKEKKMKEKIHQQYFTDSTQYKTENGFVYSNNSFGSIKQIVLDPVFKGANIINKFGGTVLDLRNTSIPVGETVVYVDSNFGGIEIYVPDNWIVRTEVNNMFSGTEDKRYIRNNQSDSPYILVIRGSASFSGIEIKN